VGAGQRCSFPSLLSSKMASNSVRTAPVRKKSLDNCTGARAGRPFPPGRCAAVRAIAWLFWAQLNFIFSSLRSLRDGNQNQVCGEEAGDLKTCSRCSICSPSRSSSALPPTALVALRPRFKYRFSSHFRNDNVTIRGGIEAVAFEQRPPFPIPMLGHCRSTAAALLCHRLPPPHLFDLTVRVTF
jgi:hypothetical protein